mmetsp:Transcript_86334/g.252649  ORF Transcript_86334/g.252649 Transcript_86334/m.252649 type:complete len:219 (+) Transcript_86334:422-1078(+)
MREQIQKGVSKPTTAPEVRWHIAEIVAFGEPLGIEQLLQHRPVEVVGEIPEHHGREPLPRRLLVAHDILVLESRPLPLNCGRLGGCRASSGGATAMACRLSCREFRLLLLALCWHPGAECAQGAKRPGGWQLGLAGCGVAEVRAGGLAPFRLCHGPLPQHEDGHGEAGVWRHSGFPLQGLAAGREPRRLRELRSSGLGFVSLADLRLGFGSAWHLIPG